MHRAQSNFFKSLYSWAHRQDENFITESLFSVIQLLYENQRKEAKEIVNFISGSDMPDDLDLNDLVINLQYQTEKEGTPDVSIEARDCFILIEAKVLSQQNNSQLDAYIKILSKKDIKYKKLILLTHDAPLLNTPETVVSRRWHEIAEYLEGLISSGKIETQSANALKYFIEFMEERGLTITKVKSDLSKKYREFLLSPDGNLFKSTRIRSLAQLSKYENLEPLVSLLKMMDQSLSIIQPPVKIRLESGQHEGGWIGYSVNLQEYFYCIDLKSPENIYFEAYNRKIKKGIEYNIPTELEKNYEKGKIWSYLNLADEANRIIDKPKTYNSRN